MKFPRLLLYILLFGFLVRLSGIFYGLPLFAVNDEPSLILGALKMLELKTIFPVFHMGEFQNLLYYPPYLSYIYLLPFAVVILGVTLMKGITLGASAIMFGAGPSVFFVIARSINVILGVLSIYLVYRIAESLWGDRKASIAAAFLLSTSILHIALSMVARHWIPISFIFLLVIFILTKNNISRNRKLVFSGIVSGLGVGVSTLSALSAVLIILWYFLIEKRKFRDVFSDPFLYVYALIFFILAVIPSMLYPSSHGFLVDVSFGEGKSILFLALSPLIIFSDLIRSEPVLVLSAIAGMIYAFGKNRFSLVSIIFIVVYSMVFYLFFRFESRFLLPVLPILAIFGGYAASILLGFANSKSAKGLISSAFLAVLFILPIVVSVRVGELSFIGDTRVLAREWIFNHLPEGKVLTYGNLMRLPVDRNSLDELEAIDKEAVRQTDRFEANFEPQKKLYALNTYTIENDNFFENVESYAREHGFQYFVYDKFYNAKRYPNRIAHLDSLALSGLLVADWKSINGHSISAGEFEDYFFTLFKNGYFGPDISIYKLR